MVQINLGGNIWVAIAAVAQIAAAVGTFLAVGVALFGRTIFKPDLQLEIHDIAGHAAREGGRMAREHGIFTYEFRTRPSLLTRTIPA